MTFLILLAILVLNYQVYKVSHLFIIKDEQDKDFNINPLLQDNKKND